MKRLERIAADYWEVSTALRVPNAVHMSCEDGITKLLSMCQLVPSDRKLECNMHMLLGDIIEGNTEWREQQLKMGSISILHTKR